MADGRATKIYMPTDITKAVSTLGIVAESLGIGDASSIDTSTKPAPAKVEDPCVGDETSAVGRASAEVGEEIRVDLESRRKDIL